MAHAIIWFIGIPVAIFAGITAIVLLTSTDRKKYKAATSLNRID